MKRAFLPPMLAMVLSCTNAASPAMLVGCESPDIVTSSHGGSPSPFHAGQDVVDSAHVVDPGTPATATAPKVPVLLFHSVCPRMCAPDNTYGMMRSTFDALLRLLDERGYGSLSSADFAAFRAGKTVSLPAKPIYLTFDDGRVDAYLNATDVLAAHGARATMFVITDKPGSGDPYFMTWAHLASAATSGAWDLELHAHAGHTQVPTGETTFGPFFAWRAWHPSEPLETLEQWRLRSQSDIEAGEATLAEHFPDRTSHVFAVPYGDYGQKGSNDPEIQVELREYLNAHYAAWFTQPVTDAPFAEGGKPGETYRYTVRRTTTVADIAAWLTRHETH